MRGRRWNGQEPKALWGIFGIMATLTTAVFVTVGIWTASAVAAPFGFEHFEQVPIGADGSPETTAGSHPYELLTSFTMNSVGDLYPAGGEVKDLEIGLPAGFVGNPSATPKCPRALFDTTRRNFVPECPADTQVGWEILIVEGNARFEIPVYNLVPPPDMPAQFGFALQYRVGFVDFGTRTGEGYALKAVVSGIVQLKLLRSSLILWGIPSEHVAGAAPGPPLLRNPTSCDVPLESVASMDSWEEPFEEPHPFDYPVTQSYPMTDGRGHQLEMTGCNKLDFSPEITIRPTTSAANTPSGLDVDLKLPQNEKPEELAEADLKDAVVTLPEGMVVSPSVANGLEACSSTQIGLTNGNEPTCPPASKIGDAEVTTPLLEHPLEGSIYVAAQGDNPFGSLLAIYVDGGGRRGGTQACWTRPGRSGDGAVDCDVR